jgi:hypothetical protein
MSSSSTKPEAIQLQKPLTDDAVRTALRKQNIGGLDDVVHQAVRAAQLGHTTAGENNLWIAFRSDKWYAVGPGVIEAE